MFQSRLRVEVVLAMIADIARRKENLAEEPHIVIISSAPNG